MSKRLGVSTIGLSGITNDIRAVVFAANDPTAVIQSITESGTHNDREWVFYGLPDNTNYIFKIQQHVGGVWIDVSGFNFTFTSGDSSINYRPPVIIQADVTTGFLSNTNTVTFDGTAIGGVNKDDWRGWDIEIERIGIGTMKPGVDYSFDKTTGVFNLLVTGDAFASLEYFNVSFILQTQVSGGASDGGVLFFSNKIITTDYTITTSDFGKKLIIEASGTFLTLTLPDISTIPENKLLFIETGIGNHINIAIDTYSNSQYFKFITPNKTSLYLGKCETISIYKQIQSDATQVWRINDNDSNIKTVGNDFHSYKNSGDVINALWLDGGGTDGVSSTDYARLYEYVINLNPALVCNYADWSTGNNKYKYSYKDATTGLFRIPDTRNMFIRNSGAFRNAAIFQDHALMSHRHINPGASNNALLPFGKSLLNIINATIFGTGTSSTNKNPLSSDPCASNGTVLTSNIDTETRPINLSFNHFIHI